MAEQQYGLRDDTESPWDDLKVAFSFDDRAEDAAALLEEIWDQGAESGVWPSGWEINETDSSGGRMVVVFRVDVPLKKVDGWRVRSVLDEISVLRDPRQRLEEFVVHQR